jgi:hypothetical protein
MLGRSQAAKAAPKKGAETKTFTMKSLWRMAVWGATAASALLIAVLTTRSEVGSQRVGIVLSSLRGAPPSPSGPAATQKVAAQTVDTEAETRRLAEAVRGLAAQNDQLKSRVAAVEHTMDDVTGSVTRQIEAVKTEVAPPWPADKPAEPATSAIIASVVTPVVPPNPLTPPARRPAADAASPGSPTTYAVDIGSAVSIQALRARWAGTRSAHPQLFEGLQPVVTLKEIPRSNRTELRLVVGPLASADAASQLCASLAAYRLFCQPTTFDGQHLALQ